MTILKAEDITVKYDDKEVVKKVSIDIAKGEIVSIIGPNGSGKSTILKVLSRYLKPAEGKILLEEKDIHKMKTKQVARKIAVLPQIRNVSSDITVETLVSYGRYPYLKFDNRLKTEDYEIIEWAITKTGMSDMKDRMIETLSGGEQQRAWIAMALAQKPKILILDEPTTFLDISYQLEVLELIKEMNEKLGITIIMVLHDINQAIRFSHKIYTIKDGRVYKSGNAKKLINQELLRNVFRIEADIVEDNSNQCLYYLPQKVVASKNED